jgi:VIT1/CCC1 family predicted Fe2+/Mn2+ transporter
MTLPQRVLEPFDRISEVLFGLIMVLTATGTLSVINGGDAEVKTMIVGALGCNLAWGIIDGGLYFLGCLEESSRNLMIVQTVKQTADPAVAQRAIAGALPEPVAASLSVEDLDSIARKVGQLPGPPRRPVIAVEYWLGAAGVCLWVFVSTIPVVLPFLFIGETRVALRVSNAVAIAMLFVCGYAFGRCTGLRPWPTGFVMVLIGAALTGVAILLGG